MCPGNGTIQCALGMGLAYVLCKWDKPMCSVNEMCPGNKTIQCTLGMGLANVPWLLD